MRDAVVRGYLEKLPLNTVEDMMRHAPAGLPDYLVVRREDTSSIESVETRFAKAIFFVNSFDGDAGRKDLNFSKGSPVKHGIWIRIKFLDGEVMEGIVHNTLHYVVNPGFFLRPTDPESNNRLVYVMKNQLEDCRVLGLRDL